MGIYTQSLWFSNIFNVLGISVKTGIKTVSTRFKNKKSCFAITILNNRDSIRKTQSITPFLIRPVCLLYKYLREVQ